jgi:hypothetical protein
MNLPAGVGIIATFHGFASIILLIHVIISIPFIIVTFFEDAGLGFLATFGAIFDWFMIGIHATIAAALFSRQRFGIRMVNICAGIGLAFGIINLLSGNTFAIFSIIIYGVVLSYIRKPHVKAWLSRETI